MRAVRIATLVEGDGEVEAVPVLLRRIVRAIDSTCEPIIPRPFRQPSGSIRRTGGMERALDALAKLYPAHPLLVLIDADDECPRAVGNQLRDRAGASSGAHVSVVLACREYEAWFLAAAESVAGKRRLRGNLQAPDQPENIRDAKSWLSGQMPGNQRYSPTLDQAPLSALFNLNLARERSRSFRKLWAEVEAIMRMAGCSDT